MNRKSYRVKFPGGSGSPLSGIVDRPDTDAATPVVVFSHCFTCNKDLKAIVRISRALAELDIAVLRYDMTGLGTSEGDFYNTSFSSNVADLHAAIRFANKEFGHVTGLFGHSFGGAASLAVAGNQSTDHSLDRLGALITLAAPSDTQHLATLLLKMNPEIERLGHGTVVIGGLSWNIRREMLSDFRNHDLPAAVSRIQCPTLLMHSPDDRTVSYDHALRLMGLIQSAPQRHAPISLLSLAGADHLLANSVADLQFVASTAAAYFHRYASPA